MSQHIRICSIMQQQSVLTFTAEWSSATRRRGERSTVPDHQTSLSCLVHGGKRALGAMRALCFWGRACVKVSLDDCTSGQSSTSCQIPIVARCTVQALCSSIVRRLLSTRLLAAETKEPAVNRRDWNRMRLAQCLVASATSFPMFAVAGVRCLHTADAVSFGSLLPL